MPAVLSALAAASWRIISRSCPARYRSLFFALAEDGGIGRRNEITGRSAIGLRPMTLQDYMLPVICIILLSE